MDADGWFRLLVTGSRDWDAPDRIRTALKDAAALVPPGRKLLVVHGRCDPRYPDPRNPGRLLMMAWDHALGLSMDDQGRLLGADWLADWICRAEGWATEQHAADWDQFGKQAGFRRNSEMAALRCDLGAAFIRNGSRGSTHCAGEMKRYGTPVRRYLAEDGGS